MVFCNKVAKHFFEVYDIVTILILIDGFLQFLKQLKVIAMCKSHNPYFNRWFSAMCLFVLLIAGVICHNPYFNRWFSAIIGKEVIDENFNCVTILILIDGFLQ